MYTHCNKDTENCKLCICMECTNNGKENIPRLYCTSIIHQGKNLRCPLHRVGKDTYKTSFRIECDDFTDWVKNIKKGVI